MRCCRNMDRVTVHIHKLKEGDDMDEPEDGRYLGERREIEGDDAIDPLLR